MINVGDRVSDGDGTPGVVQRVVYIPPIGPGYSARFDIYVDWLNRGNIELQPNPEALPETNRVDL